MDETKAGRQAELYIEGMSVALRGSLEEMRWLADMLSGRPIAKAFHFGDMGINVFKRYLEILTEERGLEAEIGAKVRVWLRDHNLIVHETSVGQFF